MPKSNSEKAASARKWRKENPQREKEFKIKRLYSLSMMDVARMIHKQKGRCAICEIETDQLEIDHDHLSGKVRGLLCGKCNKGIGLFDDDTGKLKAAILYLI